MNDRRGVLINNIFLIVLLLFLWLPNSYSYILSGSIYAMVRWAQYLAAVIAALMVVISRKCNKVYVLNVILSMVLLLSTVMHQGNINKCLNYVTPMLGTVSLIVYYIGIGREKELLRVMRYILTGYIVINIATYFLYPQGLYLSEFVTRLDNKPNTFFGNRNAYKFYGLFLIVVSYLEGSLDGIKRVADGKMLIAVFLALTMEFLGESLTGLIMISFTAIYYFFGDRMLKIRKINPKVFFFATVGICAFLVMVISVGRYMVISVGKYTVFSMSKYIDFLSFIFKGNTTFSNRIKIWSAAKDQILANPVLGVGTLSAANEYKRIAAVHAHNQFLEIALRGGIIALTLYVWIIWIAFKKLASYRSYETVTFMSICIFVAMIMNMVECETFSYAILSYFTAMSYCWAYPPEFLEDKIRKRKRIVLRFSRNKI